MQCPVITTTPRMVLDLLLPDGMPSTLPSDVRNGLTRSPKRLPPKYFYDDHGSRLFDEICNQAEYYPTRTEQALLETLADQLIDTVRPTHLVELGSGAARKTRTLLDAAERATTTPRYVPVDVNAAMLTSSAQALLEDYPWLEVHGIVGDYEHHLRRLPDGERRLVLYLGGTIGNFTPAAARRFLRQIARNFRAGDYLLLGTDLVKATPVLNAAYNDAAGITARFNLNMLQVLNRELDADFDLEAFEHFAFFHEGLSQIEMHLRARRDLEVHLQKLALKVRFSAGELMRTEISRKFTRESVSSLLSEAGFRLREWFTSPDNYFALTLAQKP